MRNRIWIPEQSKIQEVAIGAFTLPDLTVKIGGYFYVDLIEAKTGRVKEHYEFPNLLTDDGMDYIGSAKQGINTLFAYLGVGTDNTTPTVNDSTLGSEVSRTNSNGGFSSEEIGGYVTGSGGPLDSPYWFQRHVRLFLEGEGNGNLTELGWFRIASAGTMAVRSLFKDGGGSPITITKTSDDQLKVTYERRLYPPVTNSQTGSIILTKTATTHSYTASAINIDTAFEWGTTNGMTDLMLTAGTYLSFAAMSASGIISPTGSAADFYVAGNTPIGADSDTVQSYIAGTFESDMESIWGAALANFGPGGITGFTLAAGGATNRRHFQVYVSESIKKTSLDQLKINWRFKWDRAVF